MLLITFMPFSRIYPQPLRKLHKVHFKAEHYAVIFILFFAKYLLPFLSYTGKVSFDMNSSHLVFFQTRYMVSQLVLSLLWREVLSEGIISYSVCIECMQHNAVHYLYTTSIINFSWLQSLGSCQVSYLGSTVVLKASHSGFIWSEFILK